MKKRTHKFEISVAFNKACHKSQALREIKDCIHGGSYYGNGLAYGDEDISSIKIPTVKHLKSPNGPKSGGK